MTQRQRDTPDPRSFLPLTPVAFDILLSLAAGERHGYSIIREVTGRAASPLRPGTLYRPLGRMLDDGLVHESAERPDPELDDERRRYYGLTPLGEAVARAEAQRLEGQVLEARARRLLKGRR